MPIDKKTEEALLAECAKLHVAGDYAGIIRKLEALPPEDLTAAIAGELARAYNNLGEVGETEPYEKALSLLLPFAQESFEDPLWNFRMGYAYYYLDRPWFSLPHFLRAANFADRLPPGEVESVRADALEFVRASQEELSLPQFRKPFSVLAQEAWARFAEIEATLRKRILAAEKEKDAVVPDEKDEKGADISNETLGLYIGKMQGTLLESPMELSLTDGVPTISFALSGDKSMLFLLRRLLRAAPSEIEARWRLQPGLRSVRPLPKMNLLDGDLTLEADDVTVRVDRATANSVTLTFYAPKLLPMMDDDLDFARRLVRLLLEKTLGELVTMCVLRGYELARAPLEGRTTKLPALPERLAELGLDLSDELEHNLERSRLTYEFRGIPDNPGCRMEATKGATDLPSMIAEYYEGKSGTVIRFLEAGAVPGFFLFPNDAFAKAAGSSAEALLAEFAERLRAVGDGLAVDVVGKAVSDEACYLDVLIWDEEPVMKAAQRFFAEKGLASGQFRVFRADTSVVQLYTRPQGRAS